MTIPLVIIENKVLSGGICTNPDFQCTNVDVDTSTIYIKTDNIIYADVEIQITITGIVNPRSTGDTGVFVIITQDSNGNEIDSGFDIVTHVDEPAPINSFSVTPTNVMNGASNIFIFSLNTRIKIIDGDYFEFLVPPEVGLPAESDLLIIESMPREISVGVFEKDTLKVDVSGRKLIVTFLNVGIQTETYQWKISGMTNPPSEMTTSPFSGLISYDLNGFTVQRYYLVGPTITNKEPAPLDIASLF